LIAEGSSIGKEIKMGRKILLKLGGRKHLGEERWKGVLELFDEVNCACLFTEPDWEIEDDRVKIIKLKRTFLSSKFIGVINHANNKKNLAWLNHLAIWGMRLINLGWMKSIKAVEADAILCSYGDYDKSDFIYAIAKPALKKPVVRAYKESRVEYNFLELNALKSAGTIVLYDVALQKFLEKKYGSTLFEGKKLVIGLDENALPSCILDRIKYKERFSALDGRLHVVI